MKRVYVCSPLRAPTQAGIQQNITRAQRLCYLAMTLGEVAPIAVHGFYPLFMNDDVPEERELAIHAGQRWLETSDEIWVWTPNGISGGMQEEITYAELWDVKVVKNPRCWKELDS